MERPFDILLAVLGLVVLAPLGLLLALAVKVADGGPVLYGQVRIGQFGKPFRIWKFRSMVVNADQLGLPLTPEADRRITPVGRCLRRFKLDELPQLWNVLVGEMRFVGPRPEVPRFVACYTPEQREILRYKPGITDVASLLFRNEPALLQGSGNVEAFYLHYCLPKKIALHRQYAARDSLRQDLWIIFQTLCPYWVSVLFAYTSALVFSFWAAYLLRFDLYVPVPARAEFLRFLPWVVGPQLLLLGWRGQFRGLLSYCGPAELSQTLLALALAFCFQLGALGISAGSLAPRLSLLLLDLVLSCGALGGIRVGLRWHRERFSQARDATGPRPKPRRVAIIGAGKAGMRLAREFSADEQAGVQVVAFFDDDPHFWNKRPYGVPVVGMPECLLNQQWRHQIDGVVVALPHDDRARARELGHLLQQASVRVSFASAWPPLKPSGVKTTQHVFPKSSVTSTPRPAMVAKNSARRCRRATWSPVKKRR